VAPCRSAKGTHYFDVKHYRGERWHRACFPLALPDGRITGEASPHILSHPLGAEWLAEALPAVKVIAVLRDPVTRAFSHYRDEVHRGFEHLSFEAALAEEERRLTGEVDRLVTDPRYLGFAYRHYSYLARGRYAEQLVRFMGLFPREQLLILQSERLFADPVATMAEVWNFLGLRHHRMGDAPAYKATGSAPFPEGTREQLEEYYRPHNEALYALPGIDFRWGASVPQQAARLNGVPASPVRPS
jgi:hypothetical protein